LSVSGPSGRITLDQVPLIAPDLQAAAMDLGAAFNASIEFASTS
jgi:hypothetical protein